MAAGENTSNVAIRIYVFYLVMLEYELDFHMPNLAETHSSAKLSI